MGLLESRKNNRGSGRNHAKNKAHFIDMAYGSLLETYSELETAADLGYITEETLGRNV